MLTIEIVLLLIVCATALAILNARSKLSDDIEEYEDMFDEMRAAVDADRILVEGLMNKIEGLQHTIGQFHDIARTKMLADREDIITTRKAFLEEVASVVKLKRIGK